MKLHRLYQVCADRIEPVIAQPFVRKSWHLLAKIKAWQPLTFRGFLALILSVVALRLMYLPDADLVAATLGGGLLALCSATVILAWVIRYRLGQQIQIEARFDLADPRSRTEIMAGLILNHSSVIPFFSLSLTRCFDHPGVFSKTHLVRGKDPELGKRHLVDSISFPHRGLWNLTAVQITVSDNLGLVSLSWLVPTAAVIEVSPPIVSIKPLPVVAASSRSGDQISFSQERSGDLFDIKAYDPTDGIKRILWKSFARTGQLVVRRPEPAVVPEGEVALYLVADKTQDYVAGALLHYVDTLIGQNIGILFGTDGIIFSDNSVGRRMAAAGDHICTTSEEITGAINRSVWSAHAGTGTDFDSYLQQLHNSARQIHNVIVFAPAPNPRLSERDNLWFPRLSKSAAAHSLKLSVALVPAELDPTAFDFSSRAGSNLSPKVSRNSLIEKSVATIENATTKKSASTKGAPHLASHIAQSGAEVLMVESYEQGFN